MTSSSVKTNTAVLSVVSIVKSESKNNPIMSFLVIIGVIYPLNMAVATIYLLFFFILKELKLKMRFMPTHLKTTETSRPTATCKLKMFTSTSQSES